MTKVYLSILFFILFVVGASASDKIIFSKAEVLNENTARIPFKLIGHLIVVEGELLDKKGNFIIDTGSETLLLNSVHFKSKYSNHKKMVASSGINGEVRSSYEKRLNLFKLHNLGIENIKANIIDLSHIEKSKNMNLLGIIGYSILKDYEVFIDFYLNQITLTKVDKHGNRLDSFAFLEKIIDSVDFRLKKHTIVLNVYVENKKARFGLDSGAEFNQLNKNTSKKILKHFVPFKRIFIVGASNKRIEVLVGKLNNVKLDGSESLMPMTTVLTNLSGMYETYGTMLDGVIGYEFLRQKRTVINYKKEKLYFIDFPN